MKKFIAITMCMVILLLTFFVTTSAEETTTMEEIVTEEVSVTESEHSWLPFEPTVEGFKGYIDENAEEITVIFSIILYALYFAKYIKKVINAIVTTNNNTVAVSKNSEESMAGMSSVVTQYKEEMASMLAEIRRNHEERAQLETSLAEVSTYLKSTRLANKELGDEIAELLVLANIPNSKKDELYSRHLAAMKAIAEAEGVVEAEEVKENEEATDEA